MRSTFDILDAVMDNDPDISDEELRFCIVSMHHTTTLTFQQIARWAAEDSSLKPLDRMRASQLWKGRKEGWNVPLDKRVEPHNRPGNPECERRRAVSKKIVEKALKQVEEKLMNRTVDTDWEKGTCNSCGEEGSVLDLGGDYYCPDCVTDAAEYMNDGPLDGSD